MNPILAEIEKIRARAKEHGETVTEWETTQPGSPRDLELLMIIEGQGHQATNDRNYLLGILDVVLPEYQRLSKHELAPSDTVNAAHGE